MMGPRIRKSMRDLWLNRTRAAFVVLAIAVGAFGVGAILTGYAVLTQELNANYLGTNPASATIKTGSVDQNFILSIKELPTIDNAEARRTVMGRIEIGPDDWRVLKLFIIKDFSEVRINKFKLEKGAWPPGLGEVLIERSALPLIKSDIGNRVTIKTPIAPQQELLISGIVHDPGLPPGWMDGIVYGYITIDTLEMIGEAPYLDEVRITVAENKFDEAHIKNTAYDTGDWMEEQGMDVYSIDIPKPGKHPHNDQMVTMISLLGSFGVLALILSGILVATMISALLSQQIRQIGVMKAIGASTRQVMGIYLSQVLLLSLLALIIAIPAGINAGWAFAEFSANIFNFNILTNEIPYWVFAVQITMGSLVPLLVAVYPIYRGSKISVVEAMSDYGVSKNGFGTNLLDMILGKIRGFGRPTALSIRNTFRKRGRLLLTLATLSAGGAVFMVSMNVDASWDETTDYIFDSRAYDIDIKFSEPYKVSRIEETFNNVPGLERFESWGYSKASIVYEDGSHSDSFEIIAPHADTKMLNFEVAEGRWLSSDDRDAIVITPGLLDSVPDIRVGDEVTLSIDGKEVKWYFVGMMRALAEKRVYVNYDQFAEATDTKGYARNAMVVTEGHDQESQHTVSQILEQRMADEGLGVTQSISQTVFLKAFKDHLQITIVLLMLMSALVVIVGGLGLMSTMGINVIERIREVGIMQSIGASPETVQKIFIYEGMMIGVLSWCIAVLVSLPLGVIVGNVSGRIFLNAPLDFSFSLTGAILWLGIVIVFSAFASFYPAWNASRLTVNEVLAYE
jgi:putative ABC transport system permease protein